MAAPAVPGRGRSAQAPSASPASRPQLRLHDLPLSFLPAFEAAGRLGSFAAAAAELFLTPSAISQQIRALEDALGVVLFERRGRSVELTSAGQSYLPQVQRCLGELAAVTARLRNPDRASVLRLTTVATAAHEFLLPRLLEFRERFPQLELCIETSNECVDFAVSDFDAAIRVGLGWPGLAAHELGQLSFALVCSPQLAEQIREPADLTRYTLLDLSGQAPGVFAAMLSTCGYPAALRDVWRFESCHEARLAAAHGLGVTFAPFPIASRWVADGRLAVPLAGRVRLPGALWLVHRPVDQDRYPFAEIAAWLAAEHAALAPLPAGRIVPAGA